MLVWNGKDFREFVFLKFFLNVGFFVLLIFLVIFMNFYFIFGVFNILIIVDLR